MTAGVDSSHGFYMRDIDRPSATFKYWEGTDEHPDEYKFTEMHPPRMFNTLAEIQAIATKLGVKGEIVLYIESEIVIGRVE